MKAEDLQTYKYYIIGVIIATTLFFFILLSISQAGATNLANDELGTTTLTDRTIPLSRPLSIIIVTVTSLIYLGMAAAPYVGGDE